MLSEAVDILMDVDLRSDLSDICLDLAQLLEEIERGYCDPKILSRAMDLADTIADYNSV